MSLCRLLLRSSSAAYPLTRAVHLLTLSPATQASPISSPTANSPLISSPFHPSSRRNFAFYSAEEAAAERRKRKRRLRIEPPLNALQHNRYPPPRNPDDPPLPDSTSALVGNRLNLHNRVQSLIRAFDLDAASHVARTAVFTKTRPTVFTCNAIIAAMYRAKRYGDAVALFKYFFEQCNIIPNVVSYNNLINAHCDEGRVDTGLEIYKHIIENAPFGPSSVTYKHLTKGLVDAGRIGDAVDLLREMLNRGQGADSMVYNNVIKGFLELGNLDKANEFFDELKGRCTVYDGVVNATFMDWWFKQGKDKEAMESYKSLMDKKFRMVPATCNVLLEVLLKYGKEETAWDLFEQMLDNHTPPNFQAVNSDTFNIMVNHLFKEGKFAEAVDTFKKAGTKPGSKPFAMDVAGYNNIIARFCENEMMTEAEQFFGELSSKSLTPDVTSFRTLIDASLKMDRIDDAVRLFGRMVDVGLWVVVSFGGRVFNELIKNGKVVESADILLKMASLGKEPKPDPLLYDIVVRGLCNVGAYDKSKEILEQMMGNGIGVHPALKEYVIEAFVNGGKGEEIEKVLDENRWESILEYTSMPQVNRRYPQMEREHPLSQNQTAGQGHQMSRGWQNRQYQMPGQASGEAPQTLWQQSSGFQGISGQQLSGPYQMGGQQRSWSNKMGEQPPSQSPQIGAQQPWSSHMGGQQQSWPNQMRGQQSSDSTQMQGQQPSWTAQMGGHQPSWSTQVGAQQPPWSSQIEGQQQSWPAQMVQRQSSISSQMGGPEPSFSGQFRGQQPVNPHQVEGQQSSWSPQMGEHKQFGKTHMSENIPFRSLQNTGQESASVSGHNPSGLSKEKGVQPSWSSQIGGEQQFHGRGRQTLGISEMPRHLPYGSSQNTEQRYPCAPGQSPLGPSQMAGQHQWQDHQRQFDAESHYQQNRLTEMEGQNSTGYIEWQQDNQKVAV